jgi:tetratricopeptide (TPR) repeat protein
MIQALLPRAEILRILGRLDEALAAVDRALELRPDDVAALHQRGYIYGTRGQWEQALADYDRVAVLAPQHWEARRNRIATLNKLDRREEAHTAVERLLAECPPEERPAVERLRGQMRPR